MYTTSRRGFQNWPLDIFLSEFGNPNWGANHVPYLVNGVSKHHTRQETGDSYHFDWKKYFWNKLPF